MRRRKFWGWGYEDEQPSAAQMKLAESGVAGMLGNTVLTRRSVPALDAISLPKPRVDVPEDLAEFSATDAYSRASHTYGKAYRDVVRGLAGDFSAAPDVVITPRNEAELIRTLTWCETSDTWAVPYGGGSSVCGGVEARGAERAASIDLGAISRVVEVDTVSECALIEGGMLGPDLEAALKPHGLTLRHYPQSFEFSTLGGWIATRAGGHFTTLYTHIDELVQALRVITPTGVIETRQLPGSGAGPNPDRWFVGSEGALGVITRAWMRLRRRPQVRASATLLFDEFLAATRALKALSQASLYPTNCRVIDPMEAMLNGVGTGKAMLILGFESPGHDLKPWIDAAVMLCRDHGGVVDERGVVVTREGQQGPRDGSAGAWREAFLKAPYLRDELIRLGVFVETFETACTWRQFETLHEQVTEAARDAMQRTGGHGMVTCRITHVYPDGPAPYFTVIAPEAAGAQLAQFDAIKDAITSAVLAAGGTTTHHHAVGRDCMPWYERERADGFARAFAAAKRELDPSGLMNPGVLLPAA